MSSPPRHITPRLEAAITAAVAWLDDDISTFWGEVASQGRGNLAKQLRAELLEAFEEARPQSAWIPVGERLPERCELVLALTAAGTIVASWNSCWYDELTPSGHSPQAHGVTHWQPIPGGAR